MFISSFSRHQHDMSVWRDGLWHKMRQYGVEDKFVRVCK